MSNEAQIALMKHQVTYAATCMVKQSHCEDDLIREISKQLEIQAKMYQMLVQLQTEGGLGVARHRQIDRLLAESRGES